MEIVFARHGNTFAPGDRVIWIGRTLDLPLVAKGREQARLLGKALARSRTVPADVFCGSLRRTRAYAEIVIEELGLELRPLVDTRLDEIDYGEWTGRTREEIVTQLGQGEELARWDGEGIWPEDAGWAGSEREIRRSLRAFTEELVQGYGADDILLVVTSNGILRYFGQVIQARSRNKSAFEAYGGVGSANAAFKMKTGNIGKVDYRAGAFELVFWDVDPRELGAKLGPRPAATRRIE